MGPRILFDPSSAVDRAALDLAGTAQPDQVVKSPDEGKSGIRRALTGGWTALRGGKLVGEFVGTGCKARAIEAAGTNRELSR